MSEPLSHKDIDATIEWLRGNEQRNYERWNAMRRQTVSEAICINYIDARYAGYWDGVAGDDSHTFALSCQCAVCIQAYQDAYEEGMEEAEEADGE